MNKALDFLDPRRSLARAVGWLAALLSLTITVAMVWVSNAERDHLLAERDAALVQTVEALAAEVDTALGALPAATPSASARSLAALGPELARTVDAARERLDLDRNARALVLDSERRVLVDSRVGFASGSEADGKTDGKTDSEALPIGSAGEVVLQRRQDGRRQVAVQARTDDRPALSRLGLQVLLVQPSEGTLWQGGEMQRRIAWMSLGLSVVAALVGIAFARRLTRRLTRLTAAAQRIATHPVERLDAPPGRDEVSALGQAFGTLLESLRQERDALNTLTLELEQRVQARTREVERLAADSRYAAVVRERLRLARDLHDTLAHSMMAMLAEMRTLRKLHAHDPAALGPELERAEQVAHEGLNVARDAIGQMRLNAVRDLGLGPTLSSACSRLADRTGLEVSFAGDPQASSFADKRAEGVFRIAEEALLNIATHAHASRVDVALRDVEGDADGDGNAAAVELTIEDDGIGFDPASPHPGHYGLVGMREQAQLIDAELSIVSAPQRGTTLRLHLHVGPELHAPELE